MEDYTILGRIGEGAHGIVMKARHRKTGTIVALKKVLLKRLEDGLPETALREIKALQVYYLFVTSKNETTNFPIHQLTNLKCYKMSLK